MRNMYQKVHIRAKDVNCYPTCVWILSANITLWHTSILIHCSLSSSSNSSGIKKLLRVSTENCVSILFAYFRHEHERHTEWLQFLSSFTPHFALCFVWFITASVSWSCLGKDLSALGRSRHEQRVCRRNEDNDEGRACSIARSKRHDAQGLQRAKETEQMRGRALAFIQPIIHTLKADGL